MGVWKDGCPKTGLELGRFRAGGVHHRLRDGEGGAEKWRYVRENPVRRGLVSCAEDWPYFGRLH